MGGPSRPAEYRTVVVDDSETVLEAMVELLGELDGIVVVGGFSDVEAAVAAVGAERPDLVLLDASLAGNGRHVTRRLLQAWAGALVVAVADRCSSALADECRRAGASGCVEKQRLACDLPSLLAALPRSD